MMHSVLFLSYLLYLITLSTCCNDASSGRLLNDYFIVHPCNKPEMNVILRVIPKKTSKVYNQAHCAIWCQRDRFCKYAIFDAQQKSCRKIYGLSNALQPINQDYLKSYCHSKDNKIFNAKKTKTSTSSCCSVLVRVVKESWTCVKLQDLMSFSNFVDFAQVKIKKSNPKSIEFMQASQLTVNVSEGFMITTTGQMLEIETKDGATPTYAQNLKNKITYALGDSASQKALIVNVRVSDAKYEDYLDPDPKYVVMLKHVKLESKITISETFEEVIRSLVTGSKICRHPTHVILSQNHIDVDVVNTIQEGQISSRPQPPLYFTSRKDFITKTDQRTVILKRRIFDTDELSPDESVQSHNPPWVVDNSWRREISHGSKKIQNLKTAFSKGYPARLFIYHGGDTMSSVFADVTVIRFTKDNVMAALASITYPLDREDTLKADTHTLAFPVFETLNNTHYVCKSTPPTGASIHSFSNQVAYGFWFISTKTWSKLITVNDNKLITFGSLEKLKESVELGKNIRVCVKESLTHLFCLNGPYIAIKHETGETILESNPFIDPLRVFKAGSKNESVYEQVLLISSAGWVERVKFDVGSDDTPPQRLEFEEMSWFSEED